MYAVRTCEASRPIGLFMGTNSYYIVFCLEHFIFCWATVSAIFVPYCPAVMLSCDQFVHQ